MLRSNKSNEIYFLQGTLIMAFYDDIQHIINSSEEMQKEFIKTIIKPIYDYKGHYSDILRSLKFLPESSLSGFIIEH